MARGYYVYIMTNQRNGILYTGVTNDLRRRVYEHKAKLVGGFATRYNLPNLSTSRSSSEEDRAD
jgi:putative endonuclease